MNVTARFTVPALLAALLVVLVAAPGAAANPYLVEYTLSSPEEAEAGTEFTVSGDIRNRDDETLDIRVEVDGEEALDQSLNPGEMADFSHSMSLDETGEQDIPVDIYVEGSHYKTLTATVDITENEDDGWFDVDLVEGIQDAIFGPFDALAEAITDVLTHVFTSYPTVHPNEAVQEVYRLALITTFALSTLTVIMAGILFQIGPIFGVSYQQVRLILPRVIVALMFGTVSPFLLQYAVEFAEALTLAFKPENPDIWSTLRLTGGLVVVSIINAVLLVAVAALFVVRDFYILFAAAASPLLALGWALPYTRQYANSLIGTFWGFLLIGPLDMIVFRLLLALLETPGNETPEWLTALGGFVMLLYLPFIVLSSGQSMALFLGGMLYQATSKPLTTGTNLVQQQVAPEGDGGRNDDGEYNRSRSGRQRRTQNRPREDNKFSDDLPEEYR